MEANDDNTSKDEGCGGDISVLPEACVANVLSFTGPRDVGRLSMVSSIFNSVAESDAVWERFLPQEYQSIISSSSRSSLLSSSSSKKDLYLRLCDNPVLIDHGKKSFSLEKWSGKKCYMLSARDLTIVWGDTPRYWRWTCERQSRFGEVAELIGVCWLEICGKIDARMLSPETLYAAYLVYKTTAGIYGFDNQPVEVTVRLAGSEEGCKRSVYLDAERQGKQRRYQVVARRMGLLGHSRALGLQPPLSSRENDNNGGMLPQVREDGWLEIELGEFFNEEGDNGELEMKILEVKGGDWKGGLIIHGIDIKPKEGKSFQN